MDKRYRAVGPIPDMAYAILKEAGAPMHHREITDRLKEALLGPDAPADARLVARIHTEINLDNRFLHMGNGMWGLKEWAPKRALVQKTTPSPGTTKSRPKRPDFWRTEDEMDEHPRLTEDEDSDWQKENEEEPERPEA